MQKEDLRAILRIIILFHLQVKAWETAEQKRTAGF
jgi:hypothetical protein